MRENKHAIIATSLLSVLALIGAICLHECRKEFISNIFAGIFCSGVLALLIAIINYRVARKETLEKFYSYARKAAWMYNQLEYNCDVEKTIDSILEINRFDYLELDNAYGSMDFLFNDKKYRKYVFVNIYEPTLLARKAVTEACFYLKAYRNGFGHQKMAQGKVNEIIDLFIEKEEKQELRNNGSSVKITSYTNKVYAKMMEELSNKYYGLMYPCHKEAETHAD